MGNQLLIVTVRYGSSRLRGKCTFQFGKLNVLQHVIRRAKAINLPIAVCTTDQESDNLIENIAKDEKAICFRGCEENKVKRWFDCCRENNIEEFHTIDGDDPFFCCKEIRRSLDMLSTGYDIILPSAYSSEGAATVGYSIRVNSLEKMLDGTNENTNTEMINPLINRHKSIKVAQLIAETKYSVKCRMTLDYWEDYIFLSTLKLLTTDQPDSEEIDQILLSNNDLTKINSFRNDEWRKRQIDLENAYNH